MKNANWQAYADWTESLRQRNSIAGIHVSVFTASETLFEHGFGHRHVARGLLPDADTMFGLGSVTKSFTALAILRAATDGLLSLDDPVTRWLPEFTLWEGRTAPVVRQLLNQTSGLPALDTLVHAMAESGRGDPTEAFDPVPPPEQIAPTGTAVEVIEYLNRTAKVEEPGGVFCYQNDAWGLLGEIVTRATGVRFQDFVEREIAGRLGMNRTTFDLQRLLADPNATMLYALDPAGQLMESPKWHDSDPLAGAGFLRSTGRDMTSYVRFLMKGDGSVLGISDQLLAEMRSAQVWCGQNQFYGYGLITWPDWYGVTLIGHSGGIKGVSSHMGFVPELGVGFSVLTNLEHQPADMIALGAVNTLLDLPLDTPRFEPEQEPVSEADVAQLLGEYRSGEPWGIIRLEQEADGSLLVKEGEDAQEFGAFLVSPSLIGVQGTDQLRYVDVLRDDAGTVWGVHSGKRILYRL